MSLQGTVAALSSIGVTSSSPDKMPSVSMLQDQRAESMGSKNDVQVCLSDDYTAGISNHT